MLSALLSQQPVYQVRHMERLPLGTPYPAIIAHVGRLISRVPGAKLAIDFTGVGRPVFDLFHFAGISPIGVLITGGTVPSQEGHILSVPKLSLISRLKLYSIKGNYEYTKTYPTRQILVRELQDFKVEYTAAGNITFNARVGKHDDLLLALAIACWVAHGGMSNDGIMNFYRRKAVERSGLPVLDREVIGVDLGRSRTRRRLPWCAVSIRRPGSRRRKRIALPRRRRRSCTRPAQSSAEERRRRPT